MRARMRRLRIEEAEDKAEDEGEDEGGANRRLDAGYKILERKACS